MRHLPKTRRQPMGLIGWGSLLLGVCVGTALLLLWLFLADYQSTLPKNLAEQILTAYQSGDEKTIADYSVNLPETLENPASFAKYYGENTDLTQLYYYPGTTGDPTALCYEFAAGKDAIATLTLKKTGTDSRFGFPQYEIGEITGYPLTSYRITAPGNVVLFADGQLLSEEYRTPEEKRVDNFFPVTDTVFNTKTYEITDFFHLEELGTLSKDDCETAVIWSEDHRTATVVKQISPAQEAEIIAFAEQFSQAYSVFATKQNGSRGGVVPLLYPGTPFYGALALYQNDWGEAYTQDRFEHRVIDGLVQYSPTEFSCDIRFDYVIQFPNGFEKTYPYSMTYYLTKRGGRLLLVDMQPLT